MAVTIEPLVSALRWGADHCGYGDDWTVSAVMLHLTPDEVLIKLARSDQLAIGPWLDLRQALRRSSVRVVHYERYCRGRRRTSAIRL